MPWNQWQKKSVLSPPYTLGQNPVSHGYVIASEPFVSRVLCWPVNWQPSSWFSSLPALSLGAFIQSCGFKYQIPSMWLQLPMAYHCLRRGLSTPVLCSQLPQYPHLMSNRQLSLHTSRCEPPIFPAEKPAPPSLCRLQFSWLQLPISGGSGQTSKHHAIPLLS